MTRYEKQAEDYFNNLSCNIEEPELITLKSGLINKGINYEVKQLGDRYFLLINEQEFMDSTNKNKIDDVISTLQYYEVVRG